MSSQNTPGLLQALECQCEHLQQTPCGKYPDQFFITFPLALKDFSKQNWLGVKLDIIAKLLRVGILGTMFRLSWTSMRLQDISCVYLAPILS